MKIPIERITKIIDGKSNWPRTDNLFTRETGGYEMKISVEQAKKIIEEMKNCYDPTIEDCVKAREYLEHPMNYGKLAWILGYGCNWLAQKPEAIDLAGGKLYARTEIGDFDSGLMCVHYCYLNETRKIALDGRVYDYENNGDDLTDLSLQGYVRYGLKPSVQRKITAAQKKSRV